MDFNKSKIIQARETRKVLLKIDEQVLQLAEDLSAALNLQAEMYAQSGFSRLDYQSGTDVLEQAGSKNPLFRSYLSDLLKPLFGQYDLKYWPDRADLVEAIANFEEELPEPRHYELPDEVLNGRESIAKDFVITFDKCFDDDNGLPSDFRFSNRAMAAILNVVLDLNPEQMIDDGAVRLIRNRYKALGTSQFD